mmetsp:Transcript_6291/g.24516  ORF Transcript_6291/g.24516 Transcript_6291/m.24516 type:complete len:488 (-) Transcript_6291:330-1793(-)
MEKPKQRVAHGAGRSEADVPNAKDQKDFATSDKDKVVSSTSRWHLKPFVERRKVELAAALVTLGVLASAVTMPFAQAQRDRLECDALCYGTMMSARSGLSLVGAALLGRLSDRMGRKAALWIALLARGFSVAVFGITDSILMMWVALVPSALLNQQYEVLKALLADFAAGEGAAERGGKQGMLGMAAGLGFLGMGLGTFIPSQESAAALALIFIAISGLVIYVLPTSPARASKATPGAAQSGASGGFFSMFMLPSARTPGAYVIFSLRVLMGFAFYIFMAIWNPSLKRRFEYFGPQEHAKLMGFIGLSYALAQGFLSKPLLKYGSMTSSIVPKSSGAKESSESSESSESDGAKRRIARVEDPTPVLIGCCVILGAGRIVSATTLSIYAIYASMGIIVISLGVFNSAISSAATMVAPPHEAGGFFGVLSSVESFCGILGPAVGGVIHKFGGDTGALAAVVGLYIVCTAIVLFGWKAHIAVKGVKEHAE